MDANVCSWLVGDQHTYDITIAAENDIFWYERWTGNGMHSVTDTGSMRGIIHYIALIMIPKKTYMG